MMRSKQYSKNLARFVLLLNLSLLIFNTSGCEYNKDYTYLKESIPEAIYDICKNEYKMDVTAKMTGSTVWIYIPVENMVSEPDKKKKPEKFIERFVVEEDKGGFVDQRLKLDYLIRVVPETEKAQSVVYSKDAIQKRIYIWQVINRIIFSMKPQKNEGVEFFSVVMADIKNGFVVREIYYFLDIKKVAYGLLSYTESQHRTVQDTQIAPEVIGDKAGVTINYRDITMPEFIAAQILNRIRMKFQKPEVKQNADVDKEVEKIIALTVKTYDFKDFSEAELNNLISNKRIILNRAAIWAKPIE